MGPTFEVRNALAMTLQYLPAKERVAFVLKDVFDFTLEEIADVSQSSVNAVKAALHRARSKADSLSNGSSNDHHHFSTTNKELLDKLVTAFNARDLNSICDLFLTSATGNAPGCFIEENLEEIKRGSLFYTINQHNGEPQPESMKAKRIEIAGEHLFVLWSEDRIDDVWRFNIEDGKFSGFNCYYCCPHVLEEIAEIIGVPCNTHGYCFEDASVKI